jgi:hypothetical protein
MNIHFRTYNTAKYRVTLTIVHLGKSYFLSDLYTPSSNHIGGTTIKVPSYLQDRHCPKYYIGQTTPAELAKSYHQQGRANPSREAYVSLQKELEHYILAQDYAVKCTVTKHGIILASSWSVCFDYSDALTDSLEDHAQEILKTYGRDFVHEAIVSARATLQELAA